MKNVFYNSPVARLLLCLSPCDTIMLFGLVFSEVTEDRMKQATRNHECVHARQWVEVTMLSGMVILALTLIFGWSAWWMLLSGIAYYVWYIVEWMIKGVYYTIMIDEWTCDLETPYESISFEREARKAEKDANYLENSRYFAWLKEL